MVCIEVLVQQFYVLSLLQLVCHQSVIVSICNYFEVLSLLQLACHQTEEFSIHHFCKDQLVIQTLECNK